MLVLADEVPLRGVGGAQGGPPEVGLREQVVVAERGARTGQVGREEGETARGDAVPFGVGDVAWGRYGFIRALDALYNFIKIYRYCFVALY